MRGEWWCWEGSGGVRKGVVVGGVGVREGGGVRGGSGGVREEWCEER